MDRAVPQPVISVIIPTYRDWERLTACLAALSSQSLPPERYEVIVVNNDPDSSVPVEVKGPNVLVISESAPGSYAARNTGLAFARGEIIAFTDSDCVPRADWLEQAILLFDSDPAVDRLAGRVELVGSGRFTSASLYEKVFGFLQEENARRGTSVTANMFSRREVFDAVGGFDASLQSGGDTRWGMRAASRGYGILYAPELVVFHPERSELAELIQKHQRICGGYFTARELWRRNPIIRISTGLYWLRPPPYTRWKFSFAAQR